MSLQFRLLKHCVSKQPRAVASFWSATPQPVTPNKPSTSKRGMSKQTLSKREIVEEIAETYELSFAKSERILNTVLDTIVEGVADDRMVKLSNFGTFETFESKGRQGRNPQTGQPLYIPPKKRVRFRASAAFKDSANEKF